MTTPLALLAAAAVLALAGLCLVLLRRDERRISAARERDALRAATARLLHHVRNPVQSILLHADLLTDGSAGPGAAPDETRLAITTEAERLAGMLRELSAYAAGTSADVHREAVPIRALLLGLSRAGPPGAPPLRVEGDEDALVMGDPGQLTQALEKLLANALDAVAGRPDPTIVARIATRGRRVELELRDNGDGIPIDRLERVFEPFVSWKPRSMGLGLTIAREIVERHGGGMAIESGAGGGTRVRIVLPRAPARHRQDHPITTATEVRSD